MEQENEGCEGQARSGSGECAQGSTAPRHKNGGGSAARFCRKLAAYWLVAMGARCRSCHGAWSAHTAGSTRKPLPTAPTAPARMAALTAAGFLAAALLGAFLRMTTWSQSWLPPMCMMPGEGRRGRQWGGSGGWQGGGAGKQGEGASQAAPRAGNGWQSAGTRATAAGRTDPGKREAAGVRHAPPPPLATAAAQPRTDHHCRARRCVLLRARLDRDRRLNAARARRGLEGVWRLDFGWVMQQGLLRPFVSGAAQPRTWFVEVAAAASEGGRTRSSWT